MLVKLQTPFCHQCVNPKSLGFQCAYVSLNGTEVYGDVISVTPSLVTGGNNVTVDWYLPDIFTRNRTVAR